MLRKLAATRVKQAKPTGKPVKLPRHLAAAESFEAGAREWFNRVMPGTSDSYRVRTGRMLEKEL